MNIRRFVPFLFSVTIITLIAGLSACERKRKGVRQILHKQNFLVLAMTIVIVQSANAQSMNQLPAGQSILGFGLSSMNQLPAGQSILGFGLSFFENGEIIQGSLEHAIAKDSTSVFSVGLGLLEDADGITFPPSPSASIIIGKKTKPSITPLGYFSYVGGGAASIRAIQKQSDRLLSTILGLSAFATAGVFKPIEMSPEFIVIPFFGFSYVHVWTSVGVDYGDLSLRDATDEGNFSGTFGMEFNVSPRFSLFGSLDFSFEQSDRTVNIGINFF